MKYNYSSEMKINIVESINDVSNLIIFSSEIKTKAHVTITIIVTWHGVLRDSTLRVYR